MKTIKLNKISLIILLLAISALSLFLFTSRSLADDDNGQGDERENLPVIENYVSPTPDIPVIKPSLTNIIPKTIVSPVVRPSEAINTTKTTIKTEIISSQQDILATLKDSDGDGVTDAIDKYPDEDDFAYVLLDANGNGIADDLEVLIK